jgi:photosystem II stability/assembly factor-like uncharacterized protein
MRHLSISFLVLLCSSLLNLCGEPDSAFERIGPFGGDARALLMDENQPSTVYLGTSDGRIYKSTDSGRAWHLLVPGIARPSFVVDTLIQHPGDSNRIYAGAWDLASRGGGLFESTDGGVHWHEIPLGSPSPAVRKLSINHGQPDRMAAATLSGVYLSSDGGKSWGISTKGVREVHSVALDPARPDFVFAGTWQLGYRSENFGESWERVDKGMPADSDIFSLALDPKNTMYASACSGVYRSENGARSWTRLRVLPDTFVIRAQVVTTDPQMPQRVYTGTTEGLYVSEDGGQSWARLTPSDWNVHAIQINPRNSGEILIGTEGHGVLRSSNRGSSWEDSNAGFSHRRITRIMAGGGDSGKLRVSVFPSPNSGLLYDYIPAVNRWQAPGEAFPPGRSILSWLELPGDAGTVAGTSRGLYRKRAKTGAWDPIPGFISGRSIYDLAFDPAAATIVAGTDYGIFTANTVALAFAPPVGMRFAPRVNSLTISAWNPSVLLAATSLGILESNDHGKTWRPKATSGLPEGATLECIRAHPVEAGRIFAGTSAGLFVSQDGGSCWIACGGGLLSSAVPAVLFSGARTIVAADGTSGGIFLSEDDGLQWRKLEAVGFSAPVRLMAPDPADSRMIYLGTASDGVYRLRLP